MINELRFICSIHNDEQLKEAMCKPNAPLFCSMESDFFILADQKLFFMDRYINILELLIELREPMQKLKELDEFSYVSADHDEPIFMFKRLDENLWELGSIWSYVTDEKICFESRMLLSAFEELSYNVNEWIQHFYNISVEEIVKKYKLGTWVD